MSNIEGVILPGVTAEVTTIGKGVSVPIGTRTAALLGEGQRVERLVVTANGRGQDGLNPNYTSTTGRDGRHFKLSNFPIISNRTQLFKNGIPLQGLEQPPSTITSFDSRFDYRFDIETGKIELQGAGLVDQGGSLYLTNTLNIGSGTVDNLTLIDSNAPTETWTIRCSTVRRDGYGIPIDGYAKFLAQGSVSNILLDGYGNQITWQSNGQIISNGVLSFSISEGLSSFHEGDRFTIKVKSGSLLKNDNLIANYIAVGDLNDPVFFTDVKSLNTKHGQPSLSNRLSLGAQLAFANNCPGVWAIQTAPSIPRRVSYQLQSSANGTVTLDDLIFPLPLNVIPDKDTNINFFLIDPVTGIESQILPNKAAFFDPDSTSNPANFVFGSDVFSYTVVLEDSVQKSANDGILTILTSTTALLQSATVVFNLSDLTGTRSLKIYDSSNVSNNGIFSISSVANGKLVIVRTAGSFVADSELRFQVLDSVVTSARILFTQDLVLSLGQSLRAAIVDVKDASFYDVAWQEAYQTLEKIECNMVVPLPSQTISACFAEGVSHVRTMSNKKNSKERMLFIGAIQGLTPDNVTGVKDAAVEDIGILEGIQGDTVSEILAGDVEDLANYSVPLTYGTAQTGFLNVYFYPDEVVVQIGADRVKVDGFFIAAAAAGYFSGVPNIAIPITNKTLTGFTILRDKLYRPVIQEQIVSAGICLLQPVPGGGIVLWGLTTTTSAAPEEQEISIVFIRHQIAKSARASVKSFVGNPDFGTVQNSIFSKITGVLHSFVNKIITDFRNVTVIQDTVEPRQFNVTAQVQPVYSVNWIDIQFGIGILN